VEKRKVHFWWKQVYNPWVARKGDLQPYIPTFGTWNLEFGIR